MVTIVGNFRRSAARILTRISSKQGFLGYMVCFSRETRTRCLTDKHECYSRRELLQPARLSIGANGYNAHVQAQLPLAGDGREESKMRMSNQDVNFVCRVALKNSLFLLVQTATNVKFVPLRFVEGKGRTSDSRLSRSQNDQARLKTTIFVVQ